MKTIFYNLRKTSTLFIIISLLFVANTFAQKTWDGGASTTNWGDANNWSPNGVPTSSDNVVLAASGSRNADLSVVVNTTNATCANLQIGGSSPDTRATLTFSANGNPILTATGTVTIGGSGSTNTNRGGTITFFSGATLVANNVVLTQSLSGNNNNPGTITMTNGGKLRTGALSVGSGATTWTPGTGTVELTATNTLPSTTFNSFYNLKISSGTTTSGASFRVDGTMTVDGVFIPGATTHVISGTAGTLTGTGAIDVTLISASALTTQYSIATKTLTNLTVDYTGAGNQSIASTATVGNYGNLILSTSGTKTFLGAVTVNGDLSISGTAVASLGNVNSGTNTLTLSGIGAPNPSWGSTASTATHKNLQYFGAAGTGVLNVTNGSCTTGTWLGATNTDWNTATNWCGGIPKATTDVTISSTPTNKPIIGAEGGLCNNITIGSGASLTITGSNELKVSGNWSNSGTFTANTSTVTFNGTTQTIRGSATTFNNLTISSSTSTTLGVAANTAGILTVNSGSILDLSTFSLGATTAPTSVVLQAGGASNGSVVSGTGSLFLGGNLIVNSIGSGSSSGAIISSNLELGADRTFNVESTPNVFQGNDLDIVTGSINGSSSIYSITKKGGGTMRIQTNSTFKNLTISNGYVFGNVANAFGTAGTITLGDAETTNYNYSAAVGLGSGATFTCSRPIVVANQLTTGTYTIKGNAGGSYTFSGAITMNQPLIIQMANTGVGTYLSFSGGITTNGNKLTKTGAGEFQVATTALSLGGDFEIAAGTYNANSLSTTVTGLTTLTAGTYLLGVSPSTQSFNGGLTINGGTFSGAGGAVNVSNMTISSGTLTAPSGVFSVSGNWLYSGGTFTPGSNTVTFTKNSAIQTLNSGGSAFNNILHSGSGTLQLSTSALSTGGTFTNSAGIFDANGIAHTVTGLVTVSGGTYSAGSAAQIFSGGLTISGGIYTGLSGTAGSTTTANLILSSGTLSAPGSTGTFNVSGNWSFTTGATFTTNSGTVDFTGTTQSIGGSSTTFNNLTISGSGTKTLGIPETVGGVLTVKSGTTLALSSFALNAPRSMVLECGATTGSIISGSGLLTLGGNVSVNAAGVGTSGATISCPVDLGAVTRIFTVADNTTIPSTNTNTDTDLIVSNVIRGSGGGITKEGAGTLLLSGTNTYTGITNIIGGTLSLTNPSGLGSTAGGTEVSSGATLLLTNNIIVGQEQLSLAGGGVDGNAALDSQSGNNTWGGAITLAADATIRNELNDLSISGNVVLGVYQLTLGGASTGGSISGIISSSSSTVIAIRKVFTGTWTLSGANTYKGTTLINAGTLALGSATALGNSVLASVDPQSYKAALDMKGFNVSNAIPLTLKGLGIGDTSGALMNSGGAATYSGSLTLVSASSIGTTGNITLGSNGITGGQDLTKVGAATLNLGSGTSTLGALTISAGTLIIAGTTKVNDTMNVTAGSVFVESGKTLTVNNAVKVDGGSLTFEDTASLVQINEDPLINSGNIIYKRTTSKLYNNYDFVYWGSPVQEQKIGGIWMASTWNDTFYNYDPTIPGWARSTATTPMIAGKGYISRARNGQLGVDNQLFTVGNKWTATFSGVPNNGKITVKDCKAGRDCLLANPYPSAIDADIFLDKNSTVLVGTLYFWTHNTAITNNAYTSNDYASYNGVGGTATLESKSPGPNKNVPSGKIAAGQGFFATVLDNAPAPTTVTFNNAMRVGSDVDPLVNTQFFRTGNTNTKTANSIEKHRLWLNLSNAQGAFKQTLVGYVTDATNGYDNRFDGESFDGNTYVDFYSINQGKNFTIQGRAVPFDPNDTVPLGFKTTIEGSFTIDIDQVDGALTNQAVYLEDKVTNTVSNLKNGNYTFTTAKGTFNDRFVLRYTDKTLSIDDTDKEDGILVFYSNNYKTLIVKNNRTDVPVKSVALFNITGQTIEKWDVKDNGQTNIQIPIKDRSSGVYIVKVKTTKGESSKKIIVN